MKIVENAIGKIILNDQILIRDGQEWALSNKLGMYLFQDFPGWHVDCEYNRTGFGDDPKRASDQGQKRPDIIIHRRGLLGTENNLLWVEVKIKNSNASDDIVKIKEFTSVPSGSRKIQYKYGLSISFIPKIQLTWIENGVEIQREP